MDYNGVGALRIQWHKTSNYNGVGALRVQRHKTSKHYSKYALYDLYYSKYDLYWENKTYKLKR